MTTEYVKSANQEKRVYTVNEVAAVLGVSTNTVYKLVKEKAFVSVKVGRDIRISKASFDAWLTNQ